MWDTLIPLVCPRACSSPGLPSLCGRLAHSAGTFALQGWGGRVTPGPAVCASGPRLYAAGSCRNGENRLTWLLGLGFIKHLKTGER